MKQMMMPSGSYVDLLQDSILALAMKRFSNAENEIPILEARRVTSGDQIPIYNFRNNAGTLEYMTDSVSGTWQAFDEQMFVARWFDQSAVIGSELAINGTFDNWTGDNPDDFTIPTVEDANNYITESNNAARIVADNSKIFSIIQSYTLEAGKYYKFKITKQNTASGDIRLAITDNGGTILAPSNMGWISDDDYEYIFKTITGINTTIYIYRDNTGSTDYEFDNWSVDDDTSLKPANIGIYSHVAFDGTGRERIIDKSVLNGCDGSWLLEKDANDKFLFRQVSSGCVNRDVLSSANMLIDGRYNDIIASYDGITQAQNLNGTHNGLSYSSSGFQTSTSHIGIGIKQADEAFGMDGKIKALIAYNKTISDTVGNALFSEFW